ncbi:hypothetical protein O1R50_25710 [Glycomyces luteolus]|uniref:Uncharacterized protein n=1 Tax=Glycomyces luteolus TaxID=2670330 RepID=A0A9X3PCV9_9ACTN|nr:hypothetical protein [Glycomyces luteolus]MDA1363036.1 hypothetical protein [Glycomyces luteolus]
MSQREFDPEAVADFQRILKADLDFIEEQIIPRMRDGDLSNMPAFGLEGVEGKKSEYLTSFQSTWTDLQNIKVTIKKMLEALDEIVKQNADTEDSNVTEIEQYLSVGESVPTEAPTTNYYDEL